MIEHSLLHPTLTDEAIGEGCVLARKYHIAAVCSKPYAVLMARDILLGSDVGVCAVIGSPHGTSTIASKAREIEEVIVNGATEIDLTVNIGKMLGEDWEYISREVSSVNRVASEKGAILKVVFENDYTEAKHVIRLLEVCARHGVAFVKTSTGYSFVRQLNGLYSATGTADRHLQLMRERGPQTIGVKATGGIRTLDDLLRVRQLGVSRVSTTATEAILQVARKRGYD